ncbi:MAG: copper chaperone PCu(A)C [Mesorhizobium sp.]
MQYYSRGAPRHLPFYSRLTQQIFNIAALTAMLLFAAVHGLSAHEYKAGAITIHHPWSRATPTGAKVAVGYLTLKNDGSEADRLVSVEAEIAPKSEIHEMSVDLNGVMTMRGLPDGVEIPAGATVELKPGGYHLMFVDITEPVIEGKRFKGSLTFEKAGKVDVEFAVQPMDKAMDHNAHGG